MAKTAMEMVGEAKAVVPEISAEEAMSLAESGNVVFLDVRDAPEVAKSGTVKDGIHISRGTLEFRADDTVSMPRGRLRTDALFLKRADNTEFPALYEKNQLELPQNQRMRCPLITIPVASGGTNDGLPSWFLANAAVFHFHILIA